MPHLDKEDREFFDSLPDEITIYCGTTVENPYADYSWTTDSDKALCFARRCYEATPAMAVARVKKKDLLFTRVGRNESEVAIRTKAIRRKRLKSVGPYQTNDIYKIYAAVKAGALDLMDDGTNFVLGRAMSGRAMGMSVSQVRDYFYKDLEYLRFLGFSSAPDRRELILDRVDWQKLARRLARFDEEAEDWTYGQRIVPEDAGHAPTGSHSRLFGRPPHRGFGGSVMGGHDKPTLTACHSQSRLTSC